jgi:hypothetical protein
MSLLIESIQNLDNRSSCPSLHLAPLAILDVREFGTSHEYDEGESDRQGRAFP